MQKSSLRRVDTEGGRSTKSVGFSTRRTRHYRKGDESPSGTSSGGDGKKRNVQVVEGSSPRSGGSSNREPVEPSSLMVSVEEALSPMDSNTFTSEHGATEGRAESRPVGVGDASPSSTVGGTPNKAGLGGNHTTPLKWIRRTSLTGRSDSSRDDFLGTVPLEFPTQGQAESRPVKEIVSNRGMPEPSVEVPSMEVEENIASPDPRRDSKPPSSALARRQKTPMPSQDSGDVLTPFADSEDSRLLSELGELTDAYTASQAPREMLELKDKKGHHGPSGGPRTLASFPVPSPTQQVATQKQGEPEGEWSDVDMQRSSSPEPAEAVGHAVNGIEMDTEMNTQDDDHDEDEDTWQSPGGGVRQSVGSSTQQLSPVLNAAAVDFSPTGVSESYGLGGYETPLTHRRDSFSNVCPSSTSQDGMYSEIGTSVKSTRKGTGKKSIVSHTEMKRILRHSSYSEADPSEFMESNGSRQMAGGFENSELDETSKENYDLEQVSTGYRESRYSSKRRISSKPIWAAGEDSNGLTAPTQEWHLPVIEDTIAEEGEEEITVSPTQLVHRDDADVPEPCDEVEGDDRGEEQPSTDPYAVVERAQSILWEVVASAAEGGGVDDDLQDVAELLGKTIEEMESEGGGGGSGLLTVEVLCKDLRRRVAGVRRKIGIADMQEVEIKKKVAMLSREKILVDAEALGGWSEDVEEIFRERCNSAVVESKTPTNATAMGPSGVREDLLRYWHEIFDRFALEGELAIGHKKREELRAECRLQDARVSLAEQETRAAGIIQRYGRLIVDGPTTRGEDSDYSELLVNAVADGSIARRCAQLEEKVEKEIKNLAKLMESRDVLVKQREELDAKVTAQTRTNNWRKCWAYWTAVLRGYRELLADQLGARKFETASGLIAIVFEEGDPDVHVHGSTSRRNLSLPNGKFNCAWEAIANRGKGLLVGGATAEEVMKEIVRLGDRVGRLQESARALHAEKRLGTCSRVVCTDRGKLALLYQVHVPRGFGAREEPQGASVYVGVVLGGNYVDWEGGRLEDYRIDNVVVRHPFPFPIRADLFTVGIRMHVMDAMNGLMEAHKTAGQRSDPLASSVKEKLGEVIGSIEKSISVDKLTALRDRVVTTLESSKHLDNILPNLNGVTA